MPARLSGFLSGQSILGRVKVLCIAPCPAPDMADIDGELEAAIDDVNDEACPAGSNIAGKRKRGDAAAKAAVKGAGSKKKARVSTCFVCEDKKLINSKFCRQHHRSMEAMKYQAINAKDAFACCVGEAEFDLVCCSFHFESLHIIAARSCQPSTT